MKPLYILLVLLLPFTGMAQSKEAEQIIITKKGTSSDKMNIVVDGDEITVNGKPASTDSDADITVKRRKIKDLEVFNDDLAGGGGAFNNLEGLGVPNTTPNKAMLGIVTQKNEEGEGVVIRNVTKGSAAEKAGLMTEDVILAIDNNSIATPNALFTAIKDKNPGDKVTITYLRDNKKKTATATLTKWEAPEGRNFGGGSFNMPGMNLEELMKQMPNQPNNGQNFHRFYNYQMPDATNGPKLGIRIQDIEKGGGVKILDVEKGSDADKSGLKAGDIIKEINGKPVENTDEVSRMIRSSRSASFELSVSRNGKNKSIALIQSSRIKTADL